MKLNILGTEYDYAEQTEKEDVRLCNCDGYADFYEKTIRVETDYNENDPNAIKDFGSFKARVKRHELTHTFFFESGMREWAENELLVDWFATQSPKLFEAFKSINAL